MIINKTQLAREFRKKSTKTERIVWRALRDRNFCNLKFRRQHVIDGFIIDFYCSDLRLAVEIDGKVHETQKTYDAERQRLIENNGITFIRVTTEEVERDINNVLSRIRSVIPPSPLSPLPRGEGDVWS